jgi:hypothetical protein
MIRRQALQHGRDELNTNGARRPEPDATSRTALAIGSTLALSLALLACGAGEEADGMPEFGNAPAFPGGQANGTGNNGTGNNATNNPTSSGAQNGSTGSNTGSTPPAANPSNPSSPSTPTTPPSNVTEGNPSNAPINNGTDNGNSMTGAMAGGTGGAGNGGMGMTPPPPATNPDPNTPPPVTPPPVTNPPSTTPDITCPTGATFCSGFESAALPSGSILQPTAQPSFDTTVKHSGKQSIVFAPAPQGFNVREVVVPVPGQAFWARLFVQTSITFGDNNHDSLFVGSTANMSEDNNAEHGPELSEQGNQLVLNADDVLYNANGPGFPSASSGPTLSANTWHCIEAFYNGGTGDVQIFGDGNMLINAPAYKKVTYSTFRFGYIQFNTPRTIWFDDVVVAPNRVGCTN